MSEKNSLRIIRLLKYAVIYSITAYFPEDMHAMNKVNICSAVNRKRDHHFHIFVDRYMKDANGEFVKVYLYLLRHMNDVPGELSLCEIADSLNHTENDIIRALRYWSEHDVLNVDFDGTGVPVSVIINDLTAFETAATHESAVSVQR